MIDWIDFTAPLAHDQGPFGPFFAGQVMATIPDVDAPEGLRLDWMTHKRMQLHGSHSAVIQVKSCIDEVGRPSIYVSGNPAKWFQGHNVFGSDDLPGLVLEMLHRICASRGVVPSAEDLTIWHAGLIRLFRVDVTKSYDLGTLERVRNAIRSLDASANLKYRGRGSYEGSDGLIFGKGSRRWSLMFYAKLAEMLKHKLPDALIGTSLLAYAAGLLRAEVRMRALELVAESLHLVANWGDNTASELHQAKMSGLQIAEASMLDAQLLEGLPGRLQSVYVLWREGHDVRAMFKRPTFYRYRSELLKHGIDIAVKQQPISPDLSNVVQLRTVLHAFPAQVPEWALGTPLFFEPRAKVA